MEQIILTPIQQRVLHIVNEQPELHSFYLSGGTALAAFYLHHRYSDDLDFFTPVYPDSLVIDAVVRKIAETTSATSTRFEKLHDRRMFFLLSENEEIKLEFTKYPFPQLNSIETIDGTRIDSLRDVSANKLAALVDRFDPKDFVDLYFILQHTSLEQVRLDVEKKFGLKLSSLFLGGELAKVRRIETLPRMMKPITVETLKTFFSKEAARLQPTVIE